MKNEVYLPPNQHDVIQPFIAGSKAKRKFESKTTNTPRKMHSA
jgi:hypothetical protein